MNDTQTIGQAKCVGGYVEKLERELNESNERIKFLTEAYAKAHEEICQTAGKALGYPLLNDDQKNFPGATEADGVCVGEHVAETIVEELAKKYEEANRRIKWLISERDTARAQADMKYLLRAELEEMLGTKDPAKGVEVIKAMQERIKRLEDALGSIKEYWNMDNNETAMQDACWHAINTAVDALEAKESK